MNNIKTFADALKKSPGVRLCGPHNNTWLVWCQTVQQWQVFLSRKRRVVGELMIQTSDEARAIAEFARLAEIEEREAEHG